MIGLSSIYLFTLITQVSLWPTSYHSSCGYESCPKADPDALNVHLVPHSHDDLGWIKTVDRYYFEDVQYIITSVVEALKKNPERRFIQVETAFLEKWWQRQTDKKRQEFRQLVNEGRLEIINGAWSMNDEAAVNYQSTIDQFTLGLRFLEDNIGPCARPKIGWQIDPFGHSREHASLLTQFGFDALFFARIDYRDKLNRENNKSMELLWKASQYLDDSSIFTSVLEHHYSPPPGFCFDIKCTSDNEPIIDDEESPDYNYQSRVEEFAEFCRNVAERYLTNNILVTMGDDFLYEAAVINFLNMDKLIKGFKLFPQIDGDRKINVMYSTPSCYVKAVNEYIKKENISLPEKTDDFFPYADSVHQYWTGYFTSRPASKRLERQGNNLLQVAKHLSVVKHSEYEKNKIRSLKNSMGIMQHHDAITGTEQQHVVESYHKSLLKSMEAATNASGESISNLLGAYPIHLKSCINTSVNTCDGMGRNSFNVILYNPLGHNVTHYVQIFVDNFYYVVRDAEDKKVSIQLVHETRANAEIQANKLWFQTTLPPMTVISYKVENIKYEYKNNDNEKVDDNLSLIDDGWIGYQDISIKICKESGLLTTINMHNMTLNVTQEFLFYNSLHDHDGTSGAYIFRPNGTEKKIMNRSVEYSIQTGPLFIEVKQKFNSSITQLIRVYKDEPDFIEFDWIVGPVELPLENSYGREVISRYTVSGLRTNGKFYTDSNGREMLERRRNFRADYNYTNEENITANYYPVTSRIVLRDEYDGTEFAVLTDRSQGGSSLQDGQVELMVHRRCLYDDGKGVDEPLNEVDEASKGIKIQGRHFITLGRSTGLLQKKIALRQLLSPWAFVTENDITPLFTRKQASLLKLNLPESIHLLTLEPFETVNAVTPKILIRLENLLENENGTTAIDFSHMFAHFSVTKLTEMVLAANFERKEKTRLYWSATNDSKITETEEVEGTMVTLKPMEIRTFIADVIFVPQSDES